MQEKIDNQSIHSKQSRGSKLTNKSINNKKNQQQDTLSQNSNSSYISQTPQLNNSITNQHQQNNSQNQINNLNSNFPSQNNQQNNDYNHQQDLNNYQNSIPLQQTNNLNNTTNDMTNTHQFHNNNNNTNIITNNNSRPLTNNNYLNNNDMNSNNNTVNSFNKEQKHLRQSNNQSRQSTQIKNKINSNKAQIKPVIARMDAHQYESKIQDLLELIEVQEAKINSQHEQKLKLVNKLREVEDDNVDYQSAISDLNKDKLYQGKEIVDLSHKVLNLNNKYQSHSDHAKNRVDFLNRNLDEKIRAISSLSNEIEAKNMNLNKASVINDFTQMDNAHLRNEIERLRKEKTDFTDRIQDLEAKLDEMYLIRKSETALLLEINHLKDDNLRLLNMLKTTEEYKDFAYLADDCSGGVRYVKSGSIYSDTMSGKCNCSKGALYPNGKPCKCSGSHDVISGKKTQVPCRIKECVYKKIQEDTPFNDNNWVPVEAFEHLRSFGIKYRLNIDDALAKELLHKLNSVWKERETRQIQRIKSKYQTEILDLRRRMNNKDSLDSVLNKNEAKRLKQEVRSARLDNPILNKKNDGLDMVNSALKVASTFHSTKKDLENEISRLKKLIENNNILNDNNQNLERLKFNEGALWILNRVCDETETFSIKIDECQSDYEKRVQGMTFESELNRMIFNNSKVWMFNNISQMAKDMCKLYYDWKENAQRNVDSAK